MTPDRFNAITQKYGELHLAVVGDFCLDRYLEIDAQKHEVSIETALPVYNVTKVRAQPGGAGTVLNNLSALGVGTILPIGFAGKDGEGYELLRALQSLRGVQLDYFFQTADRHTFAYCKPLLIEHGKVPRELNRLDQKNWTRTPLNLRERICAAVLKVASQVDAITVLSQVDEPDTGVLTAQVLDSLRAASQAYPKPFILADSRNSLRDFPPFHFKMNLNELGNLTRKSSWSSIQEISTAALELACRNGHSVFVTLAERGIVGASTDGRVHHSPTLPLRGEIDIVGAGDAVMANLIVALAAGATLPEALELANAAASVVIHQLGTTGTASVEQIRELLFP